MSEGPASDLNAFWIFNPVWHVVHRETFDIVQDQAEDGRRYVVVFSDSDLAQRFIDRTGNPSATLLEMPSLANWLEYLEALWQDGYEYIAIDPEPRRRLRIAPIADVARAVRESIDRQS